MKASIGMAAVALAALWAPVAAAGSGTGAGAGERAPSGPAGMPPLALRPLAAAGCHTPWVFSGEDGLILQPCSQEAPAAPAFALLAPALVYPSLGGPAPTLTPLDALPRLRDVTRQADADDTLRFVRSHW